MYIYVSNYYSSLSKPAISNTMNDKVKKIAASSGSSAPQTCSASPPSTSSSPSHEFSFTISLNQQSNIDNSKFTVDLTPADDIFFHGHLLPLHLISHLPVSPRSSTNLLDSFTLPIHELFQQQNIRNANTSDIADTQTPDQSGTKGRMKSKYFSLFGLAKWRKGWEEKEKGEKQKKKLKFDISHVIKRYMRMVIPLLAFRKRRSNLDFYNDSHSFSGSLAGSRKVKRGLRGRRGMFSAPASMRTSPTNSGLLVATENIPSYTSESTMEELQAAIQAAITHCKNSIAREEDKDNNQIPSLGSNVNSKN